MDNIEILNTDIIRARIMNIEYENLKVQELENEIRRIYFEETGKEIPTELVIYQSDELLKNYKNDNIDAGFDGTVIHFISSENKINQSVTITRGSEAKEKDNWRPLDWVYNLNGIFLGGNSDQFKAAEKFNQEVTEKINEYTKKEQSLGKKLPDLKQFGYGHSLGGNNIALLQLISSSKSYQENENSETNTNLRFEKVYIINGAAPSVFQLVNLDIEFRRELERSFSLANFQDISTIPTEKLKKFTEDYYKNKIDETTIHHITAEEDMLYNMTRVRGFIDIGVREGFLDTDPKFDGVKDIIERIPDEEIIKIQEFMSEYSCHIIKMVLMDLLRSSRVLTLKLLI